tara:strand:+ start:345 stop:1034 length:690 start_codon:yes stop_codon:yes gene_type:complete
MNKENDNIEDLEKELLELKKKKLQKQITNLEKELNISEVIEKSDSVTTNRVKKKNSALNFIPVLFVIIAAAIVMYNQDDFDLNVGDVIPPPAPEFLDTKYIRNNSREYTFNNRKGCIPTLRFNLDNHPVLGQPGKTTFEVKVPDSEATFRHTITNQYKASVVLLTSSNFVNGDNLYSDKNFAGQTDLTNNIIISKEGSRKTYRISPSVPQVIFGLEKVNNQVCDYRVNK